MNNFVFYALGLPVAATVFALIIQMRSIVHYNRLHQKLSKGVSDSQSIASHKSIDAIREKLLEDEGYDA